MPYLFAMIKHLASKWNSSNDLKTPTAAPKCPDNKRNPEPKTNQPGHQLLSIDLTLVSHVVYGINLRNPCLRLSQWLSPSEATESFFSKDIWLAPPQFYEIRRLENFASLSDLHKFCLDRVLEGVERWLPITLVTADGMLQLLPGDDLYLEDSNYLENFMSTEKKIEEIMKEGKKFHRVVIRNRHLYDIHVTVQSKYKHVYPKNYIVSKSRL
ncbi:nucleoside diphosphate-linked moiety X motif 19 [Carlito syrichta]|uniref:Nucleoside diphosphate-linked moiety X motif 19 n=1 Tax=Carlito syrichta TaxID=1868482 RepID=A0A1U7T435_CARSF|nr:nucleoside diphosphate-linked moiety X motif 19 [Carlito syrichta]